ncbi:MAG: transposase [Candidatus Binatia bacterium]
MAHHRALLFGEIAGGTNHMTDAGRIVQCTWNNLPKHYSGVECDAFVVMPNHVHGIIQLNDPCVGAADTTGASPRRCFLSEIVRALKTFSARRINEQRPANAGPVWQGNYYDHVIRDDRELLRIREYIVNNPLQWATDRENPMQPPDFKPTDGVDAWEV